MSDYFTTSEPVRFPNAYEVDACFRKLNRLLTFAHMLADFRCDLPVRISPEFSRLSVHLALAVGHQIFLRMIKYHRFQLFEYNLSGSSQFVIFIEIMNSENMNY